MSDLIEATGSVDEQRERLARLLGLEEPVSVDVLTSAIGDREYARNLMLCKDAPALRDFLLQNPPRRQDPGGGESKGHSTRELVASAAQSFWSWTRSGFAVVDEERFEQRFAACLECPNLVEPPSKRVYKLIGATGADPKSKICALCGCVASKKARLPHETCPAPHASVDGMNKWGEPLA